jgi:hypothetical protein
MAGQAAQKNRRISGWTRRDAVKKQALHNHNANITSGKCTLNTN